jgi:hypothetical protein
VHSSRKITEASQKTPHLATTNRVRIGKGETMTTIKKYLVTLCATTILGAFHIDAMQQLSSLYSCASRKLTPHLTPTLTRAAWAVGGIGAAVTAYYGFKNIVKPALQTITRNYCDATIGQLYRPKEMPNEIKLKISAYGFSTMIKKLHNGHIISYNQGNYQGEYGKLIDEFLNQKVTIAEKEYTYGTLLWRSTSRELQPFYPDQHLIIALNQEKTQVLGILLHKPHSQRLDQYISAFGTIRQQKFGKSLLQYMVNYQISSDKTKLKVHRADKFNEPAKKAYEALGFQQDYPYSSFFYHYSLQDDPGKLRLPQDFDSIIRTYFDKLIMLPTKKNENCQDNFPQPLVVISEVQISQLTDEAQLALGATPAYFVATLPGLFLRHHVTRVCGISC